MAGSALADEARLRRPDLPVMLITGFAGDAVSASVAGQRYPVLQKPFSLADFTTMVAACRRSPACLR
jgi:DNA-binding LytR/AlgR family response regulator